MTDYLRAHPGRILLAVLILLTILFSSVSIVPETQQGVVTRLGNPVRIVNSFEPGEKFGERGAGLNAKIPFVEKIVWIDKRVRDLDMDVQQVLSTDQRRLDRRSSAVTRRRTPGGQVQVRLDTSEYGTDDDSMLRLLDALAYK